MTAVQKHNKSVYDDLEVGDLVEFKRGLYSHWAVFIGNEEVIHLAVELVDGKDVKAKAVMSSSGMTFDKGIVRKDNFWDVVGDNKVCKNNDKDKEWEAYKPEKIVERAKSKIGRIGFNLVFSNCEHFASWCRYGVEKSKQVEDYLTVIAVGGALLVTEIVIPWLFGGSSEKEKKSKA